MWKKAMAGMSPYLAVSSLDVSTTLDEEDDYLNT